ncbi:hypothetical protein DKP76_12660 [Falsochrobactrum shanghaiense]|uniref:CopG family transcriptional regulator n=1 Tax=Falsochrobactrum shanghaiense TaxID=2201899 RepID=A0A316J8I3_9HYPH|nr:hypothetical protein [Falsochrobactrum shanghaiense]PWL17596.1 hypothetical protein DKP76_12660 [Falsochrobactrum shanghaiense]
MGKNRKPKDEGEKKNTSLRLSGKMLKALKIRAIEEETSVQKIVEKLIGQYLDQPREPKA